MANLDQYPVELHLDPIQAHTFSRDNGWWRGIVKSHDEYGNKVIRLYLWRDPDGKDWNIIHKWNVQPDRWEQEKEVVEKYVGKPPTNDHPHFPVQHYHVVGGETIIDDGRWWSAVVQFKKDMSSSTHKTRLYLWSLEDDTPKGTGFKWNIKRDTWHQESMIADGFLRD